MDSDTARDTARDTKQTRREAEALASALRSDLQGKGIRRLAVTFINHAGATLVKVVPLGRLPEVARDGVGFSPVSDAWTVDGVPDPDHALAVPDGDLRLIPDLKALLPLEAALGWAWAPGDRRDREGHPYGADQRSFCRRQQRTLSGLGIELTAGFEIEWLVAETRAGTVCQPAVAGGPYGADRVVNGFDYLAALTEALDAAELPWLQIHPEYGPGQFELSLAPGNPLQAADRLVAARLLIQRVTHRFGWQVSFSPLPEPAWVGNGGHLHVSLREQGLPLLEGGDGPAGLTPRGAGVLGLLLEELPALLPIACPLVISYRRLGPGRWSAPFQAWGVENREAALRLIPSAGDGAAAHLELKVADLAANPYLLCGALMALVAAGLLGGRPLPDPVVGDPSKLPSQPPRLPRRLETASACFAGSEILRSAMGPLLHETLLQSQVAECRRAARIDDEQLITSSRW